MAKTIRVLVDTTNPERPTSQYFGVYEVSVGSLDGMDHPVVESEDPDIYYVACRPWDDSWKKLSYSSGEAMEWGIPISVIQLVEPDPDLVEKVARFKNDPELPSPSSFLSAGGSPEEDRLLAQEMTVIRRLCKLVGAKAFGISYY